MKNRKSILKLKGKGLRLHLSHRNNCKKIVRPSSFSNMCRILLLFITSFAIVQLNDATPLDDYVNKPDPNFAWKLIQTYPSSAYTVYVLNLTSQKWFDGRSISTWSGYFHVPIISSFSFIFLSTNLVALYVDHRTSNNHTAKECLFTHWRW